MSSGGASHSPYRLSSMVSLLFVPLFVSLIRFTSAAPTPGLLDSVLDPVLNAVDGNSDDGAFTSYDMPTELGGPCVIREGPDGNVWVQEVIGNKFAKICQETGEVTEYQIPWTLEPIADVNITLDLPVAGITPLSCAVAIGADGLLYGANGLRNQIVSINVTTGEMEIYTAPNILGNLFPLNDATASEDSIWFTQTTGNQIGRFNVYDKTFTNYDIPTPLSLPIGVLAASDGGVWFTEALSSKIGRVDIASGSVTEYDLGGDLAVPFVIRAETENRYLWFTALVGNSIGRIDMQTKEIIGYSIPDLLALPIAVCASDAGDIWFTHFLKNSISRFTPSTQTFSEYPLPGSILGGVLPVGLPPRLPVEIACKPGNNVWFVEVLANKAVKLDLDTLLG